MTRINDTTAFPITAPAPDDLLIGTDVSDTSNNAGGETVNFTIGSLGWQLVSEQSPTSGTTVTWTDLSAYSELRLVFYGLTASTSATWYLLTSDDNGSTFENTSGDYQSVAANDAGGPVSTDFLRLTDTGRAALSSGSVSLVAFNVAGAKTAMFGLVDGDKSNGHRTVAEANNALRLVVSTGALSSGSVALFGRV
jgi:hypothetical protein